VIINSTFYRHQALVLLTERELYFHIYIYTRKATIGITSVESLI